MGSFYWRINNGFLLHEENAGSKVYIRTLKKCLKHSEKAHSFLVVM
jgi:hypothetical protein